MIPRFWDARIFQKIVPEVIKSRIKSESQGNIYPARISSTTHPNSAHLPICAIRA